MLYLRLNTVAKENKNRNNNKHTLLLTKYMDTCIAIILEGITLYFMGERVLYDVKFHIWKYRKCDRQYFHNCFHKYKRSIKVYTIDCQKIIEFASY